MADVVGEVIQYLVAHRKCDCGAAYVPENVHVLNQPSQWVWDLAAVCQRCHTLTMVSASVRPADRPQRAAAPRPTELTAAELNYFGELPPVGIDDVLDLSEFLGAFDGDFRGLFSQSPDGA
jgi:hypothetical protein